MDLRLLVADADAGERDAVDALLGPPASGWVGGRHDEVVDGRMAHGGQDAREQRHLLLPALQAVQARCGWVSHGALNYICERLTVPPADAFGVATFYGLLSVNPRPARVLHVCEDIACKCVGSDALIAALEDQFGPEGEACDGATWLRSPCLGQCDRGPAAMLTVAGEDPIERVLSEIELEPALAILRGDSAEAMAEAPVRQRGRGGPAPSGPNRGRGPDQPSRLPRRRGL